MNKNLSEILKPIECEVRGTLPAEINSIQTDSRKVGTGDIFVAVRGLAADGHNFLTDCEKSGATVLLVEEFSDAVTIPQIKVADSKVALLELVHNFYENPTIDLTVIGITGTNGKNYNHLFN